MGEYLFERGWGPEERRVQLLEGRLDQVSQAVMNDLGLQPGWRCWEVGAGGGSIAEWLADQVGPNGELLEAAQIGLRRLEDRIVDHGLTRREFDEAKGLLADTSRTIVGATIVTAWGKRV